MASERTMQDSTPMSVFPAPRLATTPADNFFERSTIAPHKVRRLSAG